jgi:hypothetical protein
MAAAALVGEWGCAALLLDELDAVVEMDDELPQAAAHSDTTHTKINLCFTVPAHPMVSRRHTTWVMKGIRKS